MATVVSLTAEKIEELMTDWEGVALSQDEINALVQQLLIAQQTQSAEMTEFQNTILPNLEATLAAGAIQVANLNDVVLPDLEATLAQHNLNLENINGIDIPRLDTVEGRFPITGDDIAANTIVANNIMAGTITALEIAANTITANEIAAGSITAAVVASDIIVANDLYSREGYFGTLEASQIRSGTIEATLGLIGALAVGEITLDPINGLVVPSPVGNTILAADGSGSIFAGAIKTDDLSVDGGLTLNGETNAINGALALANVVVDPTQTPSVQMSWPYTRAIGTDTFHITESHNQQSWVSLHWPSKSIRKYNKVTGAREATWESPAGWDYYAVARAGSYYFVTALKVSTNEVWLCRISSTGTGFTALHKIADAVNVGGWMVGVGRDNTTGYVMTAYSYTSAHANAGKIRVQTWDLSGDIVTTELYQQPPYSVNGEWCFGVGRGPYGQNGEDVVYINTGYIVRMYDRATKTMQWGPEPGMPEYVKGQTVTQGGKFVFVGFGTYRVYEWATDMRWDDFGATEVAYSWYDSDPDGTGTHETLPTEAVVIYAWSWASLEVTTPSPPDTGGVDSPDSVAIYLNNQRQPDLGPGVNKHIYSSVLASGIPPKTENEFLALGVATYPGQIISSATKLDGVTPKLLMKGDGSGHWGDLAVDGAGKVVIGGDTGWVEVGDEVGHNFNDTWENFGGVYENAAYRKIGDRVYLRGLVRGVEGDSATIFGLPPDLWPSKNTIFVGIANSIDTSAGTVANAGARIDVTSGGNVNFVNDGPRGFVALNNISYFVG